MATRQDALLIIEFSRWANEWGFHDSNRWIREHRSMLESFETFSSSCPRESEGFMHVHTVLGYYENLGLFFKHGVIDEALLLDWLDFVGPWDSVLGALALGLREASAEARAWENFEALVDAQRQHLTG